MNGNNQKHNWIIAAVLFVGFLLAFFLDITGLALHQWLGVFVGALAGYHLLAHWNWVKSVSGRFFGRISNLARLYYGIDAVLLAGFMLIGFTGLLISTWLGLELQAYGTWVDLHVAISILTLALTVVKVGLHWRWIIQVARRFILLPRPVAPVRQSQQSAQPVVQVSRREFLSLIGIVSLASVFAMSNALDSDHSALASETTEAELNEDAASSAPVSSAGLDTQSNAAQSELLQAAETSATCTVRCPKGCSYPGHCHRYVDSNANNRCDMSECG
jgi:hypothetical protein